jgi:hypothetical protein
MEFRLIITAFYFYLFLLGVEELRTLRQQGSENVNELRSIT